MVTKSLVHPSGRFPNLHSDSEYFSFNLSPITQIPHRHCGIGGIMSVKHNSSCLAYKWFLKYDFY